MKTLKLALIAAILSFTLVGYSADHHKNVVVTIKISLQKALEDQGLIREMYNQIDNGFLNTVTKNGGKYIARVTYRHQLYLIVGTYKDWEIFFLMDTIAPPILRESALGGNGILID